jgi:RNA polymerase sigma-70 factor (ECF subfamily)
MDPVVLTDDDYAALMARAQQGDADAYVELLTAITPRIRQALNRQRALSSRHDVEDLVQDVLLSVHTVRNTYDPSRPLMPWLMAIVRHRVVDAARRFGRHAAHEVGVDDLDVTFQFPATNFQQEPFADAQTLAHAIHALPSGQRRALELLKLKELSLKEASAITGSSVGALKLATHRAIASLRRTLRGQRHAAD